MPDIYRTDSQRSDSSLKPRVSFNRDVHVKRIVPRGNQNRSEGENLSPKKRYSQSKEELKTKGIRQVDLDNRKFNSLPTRKKDKRNSYNLEHLTGKSARKSNSDISLNIPPKKPPRTFTTYQEPAPQHSSFFNFFRKSEPDSRKPKLRRSISDATNLKSKAFKKSKDLEISPNHDRKFKRAPGNDTEDHSNIKSNKKQLSPIIEVTPREDYFTSVENSEENKENVDKKNLSLKNESKKLSVTDQLKEYIDEIDSVLYKDGNIKNETLTNQKIRKSEVIVIDVEKAEKISGKKKLSLKSKFKALTKKKGNLNKIKDGNNKKIKQLQNEQRQEPIGEQRIDNCIEFSSKIEKPSSPAPRIKAAIESLERPSRTSSRMMHSSQYPPEKPRLTRGRTVNAIAKQLASNNSSSPPPKNNSLITPTVFIQHNNNQPFSYTRGLSPEKLLSDEKASPNSIVYAQIVCGQERNGTNKQTIHTSYSTGKTNFFYSDSDEGFGCDENILRKNDGEQTNAHYNYRSDSHLIERGRADGMDTKVGENFAQPFHSLVDYSFNDTNLSTLSSRHNLTARRDLLEHRIKSRFGDKVLSQSPEDVSKISSSYNTSHSQYRSRSTSPLLFNQNHNSENKIYINESTDHANVFTKCDSDKHFIKSSYNYEPEPKSLDSHISDYRSSRENSYNKHSDSSQNNDFVNSRNKKKHEAKMFKERNYYKSNPEITKVASDYKYDKRNPEAYHYSLQRDKHEKKTKNQNSNQFYKVKREKSFKGPAESDYKKYSRENIQKYELHNLDSEDEGFASSLLIANDKQQTTRLSKDKEDSGYKDFLGLNKYNKIKDSPVFVPRERSIDDGSHFDPRIDKELLRNKDQLQKTVDKKPPKPNKRISLQKVKQLFTPKKTKSDKGSSMVREESLRARYSEYKGSGDEQRSKSYNRDGTMERDYLNRRRLSTPSPRTDKSIKNNLMRSLERVPNKRKESLFTSGDEESFNKSQQTKTLRFFGDTDLESNDSIRLKNQNNNNDSTFIKSYRSKSQSSKELENINEEKSNNIPKNNYSSMINISSQKRDATNKGLKLKPPVSSRSYNQSLNVTEIKGRRRKLRSPDESSTEGDSSQQSQRSIVYLHAATVGDIPGPENLRNGRRCASREDILSNKTNRMQTQAKTLSRSFSVLAPWRPRPYAEGMNIDYTHDQHLGNNEQSLKTNKNWRDDNSTLKKKAYQSSSLNRATKSKENINYKSKLNKDENSNDSTLYRKKEKHLKENNRYANNKNESKMFSKSLSVESLGYNKKYSNDAAKVSRSTSMPKNTHKGEEWSKNRKK